MSIALLILFWVTLAVACGTLVYWSVVASRVLETIAKLPTGHDGIALAEGLADEPVCVVIPAHNEAANIGALVASLRGQDHSAFRVVLALDRCTDNTAELARAAIGGDERFEVMEITRCPDGWAGKVNAIWSAVQTSEAALGASLLLFSDADCAFHPSCLRAASALLRERELQMLSLLSELTAGKWFERVAQPSAAFELLRQYPLLRTNRRDKQQRPFANGQFILFDAGTYRAIGGHEAVKDELLEDIALARLVKECGHRGGLLNSGGIVRCRMYEDWAEFRGGWKRIYIEAANRRSARLREGGWRKRGLGSVMPLASLACALLWYPAVTMNPAAPWLEWVALAVPVLALGAWGFAMSLVYRSGSTPVWATPSAAIGAWLVGSIMIEAGKELERGTPTRWGGRAYVREDRSAQKVPDRGDGATKPPGTASGARES